MIVYRSTLQRAGIAVAVLAAVTAGLIEFVSSESASNTALAALAGLLAAGIGIFALTLPGLHWRGLTIGLFFVTAGMLSWTFTDQQQVRAAVWGILLIEGVVFTVWAWPWLANLRRSVRMGTAWLGVSYWILGVLGALLVLHAGIAAQRVAYAGVFGLAVLAVLAKTGGPATARPVSDLSTGVVAAFLLAIAVLLFAGAGNLFLDTHVVPDNGWGRGFEYRFWGGQWLLYHPNSMAGIAVLAAIRIGPDRAFALWQRACALGLATFIVIVTNSRTGWLFLGAAAGVHAVLLWWGRRHGESVAPGLPRYRRTLLAAIVPLVAVVAVFAFTGAGFLGQQRYGSSGGVTSGRVDTWMKVLDDWRGASVAEKLFGDAQTARAVVKREGSSDIDLTVDNAAFGALRHGGVLGVLAFLVGLGLLLFNAFGRVWPVRRFLSGAVAARAPAWYMLFALAVLPTMVTTEWLLGGTGGTVWILLVTGEALVLATAAKLAAPEAPSADARRTRRAWRR